ncbi:hypothetical protein VTO42DRAFT_8307 [Malbranchea cinnamomea]
MADGPALPERSATVATKTTTTSLSDDEAVPDSDYSATTAILVERLQAWKHMCGYLEDYITATHKAQKVQSKEFEKVLKTVSEPLREGHHFIQGNGGVVSLFDTLKNNTQGIANLHLETEKNLKSTVLPILERLHAEIKSKAKELKSGQAKTSKAVAKARANSQKHIELLGQYAAAFDTKTKIECSNDPYLLARGVNYRLNKQITEENNSLKEILAAQSNFQQFETHILETVQNALKQFFQVMAAQSDRQRAIFAEITATAQQVPVDYEWANFYERNDASLINPNTPPRSLSNIQFPNQDHRSTKPLVSGMLDRKSRAVVKGYSPGFYVVTPAGYLHGFKDNDDYKNDPSPDISLYLPDCNIGNFDGLKFSIKGKDVSGGKVGNAFHMTSELHFKAHSKNDIEAWSNALTSFTPGRSGSASQPTSPVASRSVSNVHQSPPVADSKSDSPSAVTSPISGSSQQEDGVVTVKSDAN